MIAQIWSDVSLKVASRAYKFAPMVMLIREAQWPSIMIPCWMGLGVPALLWLCSVLYNLFLHPLASFPGPRLAGAAALWKAYVEVFGDERLADILLRLHEHYGNVRDRQDTPILLTCHEGEIVRVAPNEVCSPFAEYILSVDHAAD